MIIIQIIFNQFGCRKENKLTRAEIKKAMFHCMVITNRQPAGILLNEYNMHFQNVKFMQQMWVTSYMHFSQVTGTFWEK